MARPLINPPKVRWGTPLVLPHVLLSVGLLVFAAFSEGQARRAAGPLAPAIVAAPGAIAADTAPPVRRG